MTLSVQKTVFLSLILDLFGKHDLMTAFALGR